MYKLLAILTFVIINESSNAQSNNYKIVEIPGNTGYFSSIDLAPDGNTIAIGTQHGHILLFDYASRKVTRDIELNGFKYGPYLTWSSDGKYLLLMEQFFTNWSINKDMPCGASIMEVSTGKIITDERDINWAEIASDNKTFVYLKNGEICFRDIESGNKIKSFKPANCANAFAVCNNGEDIAVAQIPTSDDLQNIPSLRQDKKAQKQALKYRQVTVFYDTKTFKRKFMAPDIFDIVFGMKYYEDAGTLYLHNAPNYRLNETTTNSSRNGYIQPVDPKTGEVSRTMFASSAPEPIFKESPDGKYFAIASREKRMSVIYTVQVYNRETGEMIGLFKNDFRMSEDTHIGRVAFEFLPDHETLVIGYGSKLALWKFLE